VTNRVLPVLVLTTALLVGCSGNGLDDISGPASTAGGQTPERPRPVQSDTLGGWTAPELDWSACDEAEGFECATLTVPLDWDDVDGETIDLALGLRPADGDRIGALVSNPGGPGGSGLDFLFGEPFADTLTDRFDIVSWDPRGVGRSTAFDCESHVDDFLANDPDPDNEAEQVAIDVEAEKVADDCAESSPGLAANVGTDSVARDLEAIRMAIGEPKLTYMGFSYGTLIGLRYLDLFPTSARAIVLDGVVDPTEGFVDWLTGQTVAIDASISRAFAACTKATKCPVDDLAATYDEVQERVEREPIPADDGATLGPAELETGAIYASYEPQLWTDLADAIADAAKGDGEGMLRMAQGYYDFGGYSAYAAVECLDSPHPTGSDEYRAFADDLRELSPRIGGSVANELLPCAYWSAPPEPIIGPVTAEGSPPVLVLGNRGDAATPYESSVKVAAMLSDGHLVSNDGEGHTSYGRSQCVDDAVDEYLIDLQVPAKDPDCR
jgi:pimeloyl-ACP methyl ester carboxylesterase